MSGSLTNLSSRIHLKQATIALLDPGGPGMEVLNQILLGFGATRLLRASSFEEGQTLVQAQPLDLIICDAVLRPGDADGYDFVRWLRRSNLDPNRFCPLLLVSSHTSKNNVGRARDCGAHFIIQKPLSPSVMLDRIVWIAQTQRPFVTAQGYVGPDRRFHNIGPPGAVGRRSSDLSSELGAALEPNMDQDAIDALLIPRRAAG